MPLRPDITLEILRQRIPGTLAGLVGFRIVDLAEGCLHAELDVRPEVLAANGFLHAATVVALADTAAGFGCVAHLPPGADSFTTLELKANFVSTAREGTVVAKARPLHLGNTTQLWDCEVRRKADDRLIAVFRCTQMVLWPQG